MRSEDEFKSSPLNNLVVMAGDTNVGKTYIVSKYTKGDLPRHSAPTIGISYSIKNLTLKDGRNVKAHLWDTGKGKAHFSWTRTIQKRNEGVFLFFYSVTIEKLLELLSFTTSQTKSLLTRQKVGLEM